MLEIEFRLAKPSEEAAALNALLRTAYRPLAEAGMRYAASHEDVEATRKNLSEGECHVGLSKKGDIVCCALLRTTEGIRPHKNDEPAWYQKPEVTKFGRFAVLPELQGQGLGSRMMDCLEGRAKELGFRELALDTAETAKHLIAMYEKRGYRFIEFHQWGITNYRSVILSKQL